MKTISIKAFTIIGVLIVVFYLLVFISFLLMVCGNKYALLSKEIQTSKILVMAPSFDNYKKDNWVGTKNGVPTFCTKINCPIIEINTGLILGVHNNSLSFFILGGYFSKFILGQTILKKAWAF